MSRLAYFTALALASVSLGAGTDADALKQLMKNDLGAVKAVYASRYAPKAWKEEHFNWDLEAEYEIACWRIQAMESPTTKQFQQVLKGFLDSTRDYHVMVLFYSTESATLPFWVRHAEGRYFISQIDRAKLPEASFPFQTGDEIISFDGRSVAAVVDEVRTLLGDTYLPTDQALASLLLTHRHAMLTPHSGNLLPSVAAIPRGPISIGVRGMGSDRIQYQQLIWDYTAEEISHDTPRVRSAFKSPWTRLQKGPTNITFQEKLMVNPMWTAPVLADEEIPVGYEKSRLPPLGEVIWRYADQLPTPVNADGGQPEVDFDASLYLMPSGKKVGFVRIPHYAGDAPEVATFAKIMGHFEVEADALVIDQLDNPGGGVFYLYALASHLTSQPLATPRHIMTITPEDVLQAKQVMPLLELIETDEQARQMLGDTFFGYPVDFTLARMMLEYHRFLVDEWNAGRWATQPFYIWAVDHINPARTGVFTKPIVVLVNELDFSGGDFFPAILQDNKRALIVGTRTAGAGGYVLGHSYPNLFGVAGFSYTASLALRPDQQPLESLGVTPDQRLEVTAHDLQAGYIDYAASVNKVVESVLAE